MSDSAPLPAHPLAAETHSPGCPTVCWSAYILECGDGTLYCGVAIDADRRMKDHATPKGSRYVRGHGGVKTLLWSCELASRTLAQRVEYHLKRASRQQKLAIVQQNDLPADWTVRRCKRRAEEA